MSVDVAPKSQAQPAAEPKNRNVAPSFSRYNRPTMVTIPNEPRLDVSDISIWPQAQLLLKHFPGTITQIRD